MCERYGFVPAQVVELDDAVLFDLVPGLAEDAAERMAAQAIGRSGKG